MLRFMSLAAIVICGTCANLARSADHVDCAGAEWVAHSASAFDSVTGKDPRRYPPDPQVDFQHIKLDLRMPDPMSRSFDCTETITFRTTQRPISDSCPG